MDTKTKKILLCIVIVAIAAAACWWLLSGGPADLDDGGTLSGMTEDLSGGDGETVPVTEEPDDPDETAAQTEAPEETPDGTQDPGEGTGEPEIYEDGFYTSRDEVAAYLHIYGHLPANFLTKDEARELGWDSSLGNLDEVAPGMSIGGDRFGNREGLLPSAPGRQYYECDIDYEGGFRNGKRIVWSNDGLIYYTEDHYNSFELLYGGDK